jgi:hypothetical protein
VTLTFGRWLLSSMMALAIVKDGFDVEVRMFANVDADV